MIESKFSFNLIQMTPSMLEELYSKQPLLKEIFGELYNMKKLLGKAKK